MARDGQAQPPVSDLIEFARVNGYHVAVRLHDRRHVAGILVDDCGHAEIVVGTRNFIENRYGYATLAGAQFALLAWAMRDYRGEPRGCQPRVSEVHG